MCAADEVRHHLRVESPVHPHYGVVLHQYVVRGGLRDPASSEPDDHDPTFEGDAPPGAVKDVPAYGVEDHISAAAIRRLLDDLDEVLLPVINGHLRAELLANPDLLGTTCGGDHPRARGLRDLDGRRAHPARTSVHEHRLA